MEDCEQILEVNLPCLLTTLSGMNTPRYMTCQGIVDSFDKEIQVITNDDLDLTTNYVGLKGSPTKVKRTFTKDVSNETNKYQLPTDEAALLLVNLLKEKQIVA
jgi:electron transfer flavoprotein beta subunit